MPASSTISFINHFQSNICFSRKYWFSLVALKPRYRDSSRLIVCFSFVVKTNPPAERHPATYGDFIGISVSSLRHPKYGNAACNRELVVSVCSAFPLHEMLPPICALAHTTTSHLQY
jgi:hypothetical protein